MLPRRKGKHVQKRAEHCQRDAGDYGGQKLAVENHSDRYVAVPASIGAIAVNLLRSKICHPRVLDSLRSELYHDGIAITLTEVDLPAVNTPQFDWARNKMSRKAQPVPPIFQPEVAARAIYFGAVNPRRQIWVGFPTVKAILANRVAPGLIDRFLAKSGYSSQLTDEPCDPEAPGNLFDPVRGPYSAHGRFDDRARTKSLEMFTSYHRNAVWATAFVCVAAAAGLMARQSKN